MIIDSSQLSFVSTHRSASATAVIDQTLVQARPPAALDRAQLSGLAFLSSAASRDDLQDLSPQQMLAVLAIEALLGHQVRLLRFDPRGSATLAAGGTVSGGVQINRHTEFHAESEETNFQASGVVETADGRSIDFSVTLTMQREFQSFTSSIGPAHKADPLVVNFGGAPARLTGAKVAFDLDSDGTPENVSFVAAGSGFLALDPNGDGKVNDGRELFGPQTGDGFSELAAYDSDGNGWIDERDPVFAKLRIWTVNGLSTLSDKGIGAISTSSAATPFDLKHGGSVSQGDVRSTGIYVSENGSVDTIQQVDLAEA